jgi:hypothetical protein
VNEKLNKYNLTAAVVSEIDARFQMNRAIPGANAAATLEAFTTIY